MAPIKLKFLNSYNSLIALLISIMGFSSSCDPISYEYGSPHADFIINGKIESAANNEMIPDIIVEMRNVENTDDGQSNIRLVATGFSNSWTGSYYLTDNATSPEDKTYQIKFTDTDGALNGEYETLDTTVVFKDPKFTNGDGHWDRGVVGQELNIKLKPKK